MNPADFSGNPYQRRRFWTPFPKNKKQDDLCHQRGAAVQRDVVESSGAAGKVSLVPLIEAGNQGRHEK